MAILGLGFAIALLYLVNLFTKYFKSKTLVFWSLLFSTLCLFITVFVYHASIIWVAGFLLATSMAIAYPLIVSLYSDTIGADKQGWIMGVSNAVMAFAWAITAFFGGFMQNISDGFGLIFAALMMLIATLLVFGYKK